MAPKASAPLKPKLSAAQPRRIVFDPYNSASTGHQRAESRIAGSTSWRDSRTLKMNAQFGGGIAAGGGERLSDRVGAGSEGYGSDGRTDTGWDESVRGWRGRMGIAEQGWGDVAEMISGKDKTIKTLDKQLGDDEDENRLPPPSAQRARDQDEDENDDEDEDEGDEEDLRPRPQPATPTPATAPTLRETRSKQAPSPPPPQIFSSLTIQINGSTYPTISDHKLKYLLTAHGARLSISHARRQVTHVIIGRPSSSSSSSTKSATANSLAAGGGLAAGKLEREILKTRSGGGLSKGVRYVSVEWVTESVKAGIRLPESRFPGVSVAPKGVRSVRDMFQT